MMIPQHPEDVTLDLYQHDEREKALRLSPDGHAHHSEWVPKSLLTPPQALQMVRVHGEALHKGTFHLAKWKADELGWVTQHDERQGEMF